MNKVKAGDRVKYNDNFSWMAGQEYVVSSAIDDRVRFTDGGWEHACNLEIVAPAPSRPAIVARVGLDDRPIPSARPFVHADKYLAQQEAERLAEANPGTAFEVYELVSRSKAPAPVATTEVL